MNKNTKKILYSCLLIVAIFFFTAIEVKADYKGFAGSAGYQPRKVGDKNMKNNYQYLAGINWQDSDHTNHKMWFRIRNYNGEERGSVLISRPGNGTTYLRTDATNGYYYYLYANREHIVNPSTYVTGTWQP